MHHPKLHTVLELRPHQLRAEWDNPFPPLSSNTVLDSLQGSVCLCVCLCVMFDLEQKQTYNRDKTYPKHFCQQESQTSMPFTTSSFGVRTTCYTYPLNQSCVSPCSLITPLKKQDLDHCVGISSKYLPAVVIPVPCNSQQFWAAASHRKEPSVLAGR